MSGENVNDRVHFGQTEQLVGCISLYPDDYGNEWRIELLGSESAVFPIVNLPRIILNAIPENHPDFAERHDNAKRWAEVLPLEDEPSEPAAELDELPELRVHVALTRVASPGVFHVVDMEFDPFIAIGKRHLWTFELRVEVHNFRIAVTKTDGNVGYSSWTTNGNTVGHARVWHTAGNPGAWYDISSHVGTFIVQ